ncbi:uncharacterized protein [Macrobrachium rosenbergii]|uniref:uncharacterized protein n=1 Tax=Macrobrachium rosenbergii TaxID=79674 RepID=UPI0034D5F975
MKGKFGLIFIGCLIVVCYSKKSSDFSDRKYGTFYQKSVVDDEEEDPKSVAEKPSASFPVNIAERILGALNDVFEGLLKGRQANDPLVMFGNGLKFGLYMVLSYYDRQDCYQRCWCTAGSVLGLMSNTSTAALLAVRYVAPPSWHHAINLAEEGALGIACNNYRCGPQTDSDPRE